MSLKVRIVVLLVSASLVGAACSKSRSDLRGRIDPSPDGKTYLVIDDDNGGNCSLAVDHVKWVSPLHVPGIVTAGKHAIECNGEIEVVIESSTTFHFDYWGP